MLEFQEGFFEQEVRDGFYIDTTMKTVWAAELEVLQKVAEICDRHGLVWYAAYGTLLGAIRHEGFVPWDDDMDIWVKRKDYNKLLKILPEELPEGYFVRSPLTKEGYDQFHTLVNSGNRVSIDPKWLEQYHGCPFSVGLDIFPLDYLARDEKERVVQENLVRMSCRGAQVASTLLHEGYAEAEEPEEAKKEFVEEIEEAIGYLEANCGITIDHKLVEEEKWFALASEFGKWGNYFAMMYEEEESDYLVNFVDYIRWSWKKFPKECFAEVYGATFENFMLPVPCGYDEALRRIYGDYEIIRKKTGTHEYPYYARQLKALKEMLHDKEKSAEMRGVIPEEAVLSAEQTAPLPAEWEERIKRADGKHKKVVLCANDISVFLTYKEKAVDRLERMLKTFEEAKESVALWWRPQKSMEARLETVSQTLALRYRQLLHNYREAGWGICDETDNIDRAVEFCNAYYGDMNPILQSFQNMGKPIMLCDIGECEGAGNNNKERYVECRAFLSFADYAEDEEKIYFANTNYNALMIVNKKTQAVEEQISFAETELMAKDIHLKCIKRQNKICFLPVGTQSAHIYDTKSAQQYVYKFLVEDDTKVPQQSWDYFEYNNQVYLLPCCGGQGMWKWNVADNEIEKISWWKLSDSESELRHGSMGENSFYSLCVGTNKLYITDMLSKATESFSLPDEQVLRITYDGQDFWYLRSDHEEIVCWNPKQGMIDRYRINDNKRWKQENVIWGTVRRAAEIRYENGNLLLFSEKNQSVYVLDREKRVVTYIGSIENKKGFFLVGEVESNFKRLGDKLLRLLKNSGDKIVIDLNTLNISRYGKDFSVDKKIRQYNSKIAWERNALLYERVGEIDLDMLIYWCTEEER